MSVFIGFLRLLCEKRPAKEPEMDLGGAISRRRGVLRVPALASAPPGNRLGPEIQIEPCQVSGPGSGSGPGLAGLQKAQNGPKRGHM